jgi:hypothetical protein
MQRFTAEQKTVLPLPIIASQQHPQGGRQADHCASNSQRKPSAGPPETNSDAGSHRHGSNQEEQP